jgi:hypothetical protein
MAVSPVEQLAFSKASDQKKYYLPGGSGRLATPSLLLFFAIRAPRAKSF